MEKLSAWLEVLTTDRKIIGIALEFGYDSPDSFTKAFARLHGLTPAALQKIWAEYFTAGGCP